jgi:hypothetical protein
VYLSKSDFKVARSCGTKLYYKKLKYPSKLDENPYLEFLADGGYMVETIAKLLFPRGQEVPYDSPESSATTTAKLLEAKSVTLFEATVLFDSLLARIDILEKKGNQLRLIEVKAKGVDFKGDTASPFRGAKGQIASGWLPYLEDVAFQTHVLRSAYPDLQLTPCLCLVDKNKTCSVETSFDKFLLEPRDKSRGNKTFSRPKVTFTGDIDALREQPFVQIIDVSEEVEELLPEVRRLAMEYAASLTGAKPTKIAPEISVACKKCEYRLGDDEEGKNGFRECWGALADPKPHLLDLYRIDALGKKGEVAARMIEEGRCGLLDVSTKDLRNKLGDRQAIQLEGTRKGKEFLSPHLVKMLKGCTYPLHFIDFEASRVAVPYHPGMKPYEQVAFQWSCHTIKQAGGELEHAEWINIEDAYPNFEFARSLQKVVGETGTVFVWSPFERTALRDVRRQLVQYKQSDAALAKWLDYITADTGPLVDLCNLCKEYYFHPRMGGSLSIKHVLPAVWYEDDKIRNHAWFSEYLREIDGHIVEPYKSLEALPFDGVQETEQVEAVREGTGAIRTYQEMMFGLRKSDQKFKDIQKQLLLNYCKLDTAAMVMIWMHWTGAYD